ncbi:hypothetical protein BNJ_00272 [Kaumoebavirus]|uniref:hypothetical protein n=1 Tax=Kaumoebavirus TaxID=1859492 RepID=UPI0009C3B62E|nr:hypothetical protein BNJ_00272 [Kaumoebavirus]ARA72096.1 hypothetical protein BNJ_00272 [Kaumoebavirus]
MSIELHKIFNELPIIKDGYLIKESIGVFVIDGRRWFLWSDLYGILTSRKRKMARWNANLGRKPEDVPRPAEYGFLDGENEEDWRLVGISQSKGRGGGPARWVVSRHVRDQMFTLFPRFAIAIGDEPEANESDESSDSSDSDSEGDGSEERPIIAEEVVETPPRRITRSRAIIEELSDDSESESSEEQSEMSDDSESESAEAMSIEEWEQDFLSNLDPNGYEYDSFVVDDDE